MSVLIKGMDMPKNGESLVVELFSDGNVKTFNWYAPIDERHIEEYIAVEVPTPHSELIDRNEVMKSVCKNLCIKSQKYLLPAERSVFNNILNAETVIEAEE